MKRKNLFLFPILILISTLCFINVSCFSGFQEKGELSITFTESTIRQIMARGADISEEQEGNDFDIPSFEFLDNGTLMSKYVGYTSGGKDVFALYVFTNNKYAVYSATKMSEIDYSKYEEMATIEDYTSLVSDPDYIKLLTDPYSILDPAIVSKGTWTQSGSSILITETHYMSAASGKLTEVSNPSVIATIPQDAKYFTAQSNSRYVITFYTSTKEDDYYDDEPVDSAKLLVRVVAGNIAYEKTLPVYYNTKAAHVEFTDLPVGVTAKVSALVYFDHLGEEREVYAKGESEEFVIQAGTNTATINLRLYEGYEEDDPADLIPPSGTIVDCFSNKTTDSSENSYILVLYDTQYSVYEFSPDVREEHKDEIAFSADTTKDDVIRIISGILKYGNVVSFGKYTYTVNSQDAYNYSYTEQAYYDSDSQKFRSSKYSGSSTGDVKYLSIYLGSVAGWNKEFVPYSFKSSDEPTQNFTFMISGYEMNDFLDLGDNVCYVTLYEIKDSSVMQSIKTTLDDDEITDAQKAKVLIPIIESSQSSIFTIFQPGVTYDTISGITNEVDDNGNIIWSGKCNYSTKDGESYGVLATVYFSHTSDTGFYEFGIAYADNLTLSSKSNEVALLVEGMNIPCNVYFEYDDKIASNYTVRTALTNIEVVDSQGNLNESFVNEILSEASESVSVLEDLGYKYNDSVYPYYYFENGVPYVTLHFYYDDSGDDPIIEEPDPVEETPQTGVDVELDDSTANASSLNLTYTDSEDSYSQKYYTFTLAESNPDVTGFSFIWTIDGVEEAETGSQLKVYEDLLSIGRHSIALLAVSPDGSKVCEGESYISVSREVEKRVAFVSTDRGLEFRVNRFTEDTYFENIELREEESQISVKADFEETLSGWKGYWPFVEPDKEYTFVLRARLGEETQVNDHYQYPVKYEGSRNTPISEALLSKIETFRQQNLSLNAAPGLMNVSFRQSSNKELTNMFTGYNDISVTKSSLCFDVYDSNWGWYMSNYYNEDGFIPESVSNYDVIYSLPEDDWGRNNVLNNLESGSEVFVTLQAIYVLNDDKNQYFVLPWLISNSIRYN